MCLCVSTQAQGPTKAVSRPVWMLGTKCRCKCWGVSKHFWSSLASVSFCISVAQHLIFTAVFSSKEGRAPSIMHVATTPFLMYLRSSLRHFWQVEFPVFYAHIAINLLDFFPFLLYQGNSSPHTIKSVLAYIFFFIFSICSLLSVTGPQWPQLINMCGVQQAWIWI